jgi:ribosomal protein S8E
MEFRICEKCGEPLEPHAHGNQKMHPDCAYEYKKERQKRKYQIGNQTKLAIQKNETIAERLWRMDEKKQGISYLRVMEEGFKFNVSTQKVKDPLKTVYMMDQYGYQIKQSGNEALILFYHVSEL